MNEIKNPTPQEILTSIIEKANMNLKTFAMGMNQPYSKVFDIYRGKTRTFSSSMVRSLKESYGVTERYLLTGKGEMFESDKINVPSSSDDLTNSFLKVISAISDENKALKEENSALKIELARYKGILERNGIIVPTE